MTLTLRCFNSKVRRRKTWQKEGRAQVRRGLGQEHARFEGEKGEVRLTGVQNGAGDKRLQPVPTYP